MAGKADLGQSDRTSLGHTTDNLAALYSSLADDDSLAAKKREAAMMLSAAEGHLEDDGSHEEGHRMASEALRLYTEVQDLAAEADALRVLVHALRRRTEAVRFEGATDAESQIQEAFAEAEALARDNLERFKGLGCKRGEAAMMLAVAEVDVDRRSLGSCRDRDFDESYNLAAQARQLFHEVEDPKMEGLALLLMADVTRRKEVAPNCWRTGCTETLESLISALELFQQAGDGRCEAKALHTLGIAHMIRHEFEDGVQCTQEALDVYKRLGLRKLMAFELLMMAQYYLQGRSRAALPLAEDALEMFKDVGDFGGKTAHAVQAVVQSLILRGDDTRAMAVAEEWAAVFKAKGKRREHATVLTSVANVYMAQRDVDTAIQVMEGALSVIQEIGDLRWEEEFMLEVATVHLMKENFKEATDLGKDATAIAQTLRDRRREAFAMNKVNEVNLAKNDVEAFIQTSLEQRAIFQELEDTSRAASCLLSVAGINGGQGKFEEAWPLAHECLDLFQEVGDREGEARALNFMAEFHSDLEEYEQAVAKAKEMRACYRDTGDRIMEAQALRTISGLHIKFGHIGDGVRAANEALSIVKKSNDKQATVEYLILVADSYLQLAGADPAKAMRSLDKAERPAKEAMHLARALRNKGLIAGALYALTNVHLTRGRLAEALVAARDAVEIFREIQDKSGEAAAVLIIAQIHLSSGRNEEAVDAASEALLLGQEQRDLNVVQQASEVIESVQGQPRVVYEQPDYGAPEPQQAPQPEQPQAASSAALAKPKGLDPQLVMETVQEMAKAAIGLDDAVYLDSPLMDSGMDSLTAVSFRNGLQQNLGVKLPTSLMFDYPTMREVAGRIVHMSLANG